MNSQLSVCVCTCAAAGPGPGTAGKRPEPLPTGRDVCWWPGDTQKALEKGRESGDPGPVLEGSWEETHPPDAMPASLGIPDYQAQDPRRLLVPN